VQWTPRRRSLAQPRSRSMQRAAFLGCALCSHLSSPVSQTASSHELMLWCCQQWPGVSGEVNPPNAALRLYGGAAFERALNEFQLAVETLEFPKGARWVSADASVLLWLAADNPVHMLRCASLHSRSTL